MGYLFSYGYIFLVMVLAGILPPICGGGAETSRKCIHIFLSFTWLLICHFLRGTIHMLIIPFSFIILNSLSVYFALHGKGSGKGGIFRVMERENPQEETLGTVYYAISCFFAAALVYWREEWFLPCTVGIFCMAFGDALAGIIGRRARGWPARTWIGEKTVAGTTGCIVASGLVCACISVACRGQLSIRLPLLVGLASGILETAGKGLDNITVPMGCAFVAYCLI